MKLEAYRFFENEELTDQEKLFAWFVTEMFKREDNPFGLRYTLSVYDLKVILRGSTSGEFTPRTICNGIAKYVDVGFITAARATITLTPRAKKSFVTRKEFYKCSTAELEITDQKVINIYVYLLGVMAGSTSMFNDDKYFGQSNHTDSTYHKNTKKLGRLQIGELLNAQLDRK